MLRFLLFVVVAGAVGCGSGGPGGSAGGSAGRGGAGGTSGVPTPADMVPELLMAHGLRDVWAAPTGERFVVGPRGMVAHFDGARWVPAHLPDLSQIDFRGVFGFAADNVYAVGEDFVVLHYDGSGWTVEETPDIDLGQFPPNDAGLFDVWGTGATNVYAVGDGTVLRYDGDMWSEVELSFDDGIRWEGVHGSSFNSVFLAGGVGNFEAHAAYFNGSIWQSLTVPPVMVNTAYVNVWAATPVAAYFAGINGRISFWNGISLTDMLTGTTDDFADVGGTSDTDVYAITNMGELLHFDGSWSSESNAPIVGGGRMRSLFRVSADDLLAVGTGVLQYDGTEWVAELVGDNDLPVALWSAGSDNALILGGRTYRYDGTRVFFEDFNSVNVGTLTAAWGPADQIIAVNTDGSSFLYDGVNWGERNTNNTERLNAVWGSTTDDVFAVGNSGTILHFNGAVWEPMDSGTALPLSDIHGSGSDDVYAVAGGGTIIHYDGDAWLPMNSGTGEFLQGVHVFDPSTIYALHESGPSIGNGATWMLRPFEISGATQQVLSLDGAAPDDFFLGSVGGSVNQFSHYDGTTFTPMPGVFPSRVMLVVGPLEFIAAIGGSERYVVRLYVP